MPSARRNGSKGSRWATAGGGRKGPPHGLGGPGGICRQKLNMSADEVINVGNRDLAALDRLQRTFESHAMGVPALLFRIMVKEIKRVMTSGHRRRIFVHEDLANARSTPRRPSNREMEQAMTSIMNEISRCRGPGFQKRKALLQAVSRRAIVTKWTTSDGSLKPHVSAVLWMLARVMVQDTWGVAVPEGELYELIDPTWEEDELDLETSGPITEVEVAMREVQFLDAGEQMKQFWERSTADYAQRFKEPLALEKAELARFVHVMRNVQTLVYQHDHLPTGWVWHAPDEYWDGCYTVAVLGNSKYKSSRPLVDAILARYDKVRERLQSYHDLEVEGLHVLSSKMWLTVKADAEWWVSKTKNARIKEEISLQQRQGQGRKRKARTMGQLDPPYCPKRARGALEGSSSSANQAVAATGQPERSSSPSVTGSPALSVMLFSDGTPRGQGWTDALPIVGVDEEGSRVFATFYPEATIREEPTQLLAAEVGATNMWDAARSRQGRAGTADDTSSGSDEDN